MDLPVELRLIIAKYALLVPNGLGWRWLNYRKGPCVATLIRSDLFAKDDLDTINALARTCKTLSEKCRGLVLQVNVVNFDIWEMHELQPPRRCTDQSDGLNAYMTAIAEALEFFGRFVPLGIRPNLAHIQLHVYHEKIIEEELDQFLRLAGGLQHLKITIRVDTWYRRSIDDRALRRLELLEEKREPYVPEKEQIRADIDQYMGRRQAVQDIVSKAGKDNWN